MIPRDTDREAATVKKRLTYILVAVLLGLLCSTHPRKYFQEAEYKPSELSGQRGRNRHKNITNSNTYSSPRYRWSPGRRVRQEDEKPSPYRHHRSRRNNPDRHIPSWERPVEYIDTGSEMD